MCLCVCVCTSAILGLLPRRCFCWPCAPPQASVAHWAPAHTQSMESQSECSSLRQWSPNQSSGRSSVLVYGSTYKPASPLEQEGERKSRWVFKCFKDNTLTYIRITKNINIRSVWLRAKVLFRGVSKNVQCIFCSINYSKSWCVVLIPIKIVLFLVSSLVLINGSSVGRKCSTGCTC